MSNFEKKVKEEFEPELAKLVEKYNVGLTAVPFINHEGRIGARLNFVDMTQLPKEDKLSK